jgi:hypothetical protein
MNTQEKEKWEELAEFHFNNETNLPEKAQLYLTGISYLARNFMDETNATKFNVSAILPHKGTGKRYEAIFILKELKE